MLTFTVGVANAALNIGLYAAYGYWWSLLAAGICGGIGIGALIFEGVSR